MELINTWTDKEFSNSNQNKASRFRTKNAFLVYLLLQIVFSTIVLSEGIANRGHSLLLLSTIVYWGVATIPVLLSHDNLIHPLFFQMLFEIPKVLSLATRATGNVYICNRWIMDVPYEDAVHFYIKCVAITCIGLIVEYLIVWRINVKTKGIRIQLTRNTKPVLLIVIACMAFFLLMQGLGGLSYVFANYQSRLTEFSADTNLYYRYIVYWGILPCLYFYLKDYRFLFFLTLIINILMLFMIGERGGIIIALGLSLFTTLQLKHNKQIKFLGIVFFITILILIYEGIGSFRDKRETDIKQESRYDIISEAVIILGDIQHFSISSELIYDIDKKYIKHTWGAPLLNILYAGFPRKLFPWKPTYIAESVLVGSLILDRDEDVYGLPPGVFAYGYLNFGWAGVVLFSVVCGLFMKWFYFALIEVPRKKEGSIPDGNILLYALSSYYAYTIISTEVQTKLIMNFICFFILYIIVKPNGKTQYEKEMG